MFRKKPVSEILKKQLNLADYEVKLNEMDEKDRLEYLASAKRVVEEPAFKENFLKAINAQADLTFREKGNLHDSKVAIMAIRMLEDVFDKQARHFDSLQKKSISNPYDIG